MIANKLNANGGLGGGGGVNASAFGISFDGMRHLTQGRLYLTIALPLSSVVSSNQFSSNQFNAFFWHLFPGSQDAVLF